MTSTTTTKVTIHNSLVLVRNVPKYTKGTEWYLCKKENKTRIDRYILCNPNNTGGRFDTKLCPDILVYVNRPWLGEYIVESRYGRFVFTDMTTVKQFCNYVGTSSPDESGDNGDHYIDTEYYLKTVFGPLCKY